MAEKTIVVLTNLLEVRRLLRFTRISTDKNKKKLKPMLRYISTSRINEISDKIRTRYCIEISDIAKKTGKNIGLILHAQTLLKTHLAEPTNLYRKLQAQTDGLLEENYDIKQSTETAISNMSTTFKTPLQVVINDLAKRFKTKNYTFLSDGEDTWGVLTLTLKEKLYCVVSFKENVFFLKTYINDMPSELSDSNNAEFKSPAQAFTMITKIIQEDGL